MKNQASLVAEIHASFKSEGEKLLLEAQDILKGLDLKAIEKSKRLMALGFHNSDTVVKNVEQIEKEVVNQAISEAITQYSISYPNYKFITEKSVVDLCKKYGLIFTSADRFISDIPDKNLEEIEKFNDDVISKLDRSERFDVDSRGNIVQAPQGNSFFICALPKDIKLRPREKFDGISIVKEDPIVLYPVPFGYLIVTAWGIEAQDEKVFDARKN